MNFNSHAHVERDGGRGFATSSAKHFNSHAHVERDRCVKCPHSLNGHFNSHAHVERDEERRQSANHNGISTHTLTWSVTYAFICSCRFDVYFNSHAHVERDWHKHYYLVF